MATIKKSNTTRIFEKNNFAKFLPILSNENLLQKLLNSKDTDKQEVDGYLKTKRVPLGEGEKQIDPARISELLQSISTYGKFTNEIIHEISDIKGLGESFKITYISPDEFKTLKGLKETDTSPDFLSKVSMQQTIYAANVTDTDETVKADNINSIEVANKTFPYFRDKDAPGLSSFQVLNPEFRGCFKNSQELDLFFNMISTLDMSMAMPYVNAEFLIPKKVSRNTNVNGQTYVNDRSYLTASLNNFILGDDYFQKDNGVSKYDDQSSTASTARAVNGDYYTDYYTSVRNSVRTSNTETQSQIKKTYHRQSLNNAIFFAPQTMVNGDYNIAGNPNAIVDKFRPFMSIMNLSFDVRPTKGLLFYKTATLDLILYDKARMTQIAPFIKPELLNTVSSEIILEYGWQSNLGDEDYNRLNSVTIGQDTYTYMESPIAEFINSLKVREKYIIVNSSYTINENGTVNINLSLAMKGPAELRGLTFRQDLGITNLKSSLNSFIDDLQTKARNAVGVTTQTDTSSGTSTSAETGVSGLQNLTKVISDLNVSDLDEPKLNQIENAVKKDTASDPKIKDDLLKKIKVAREDLSKFNQNRKDFMSKNFSFLEGHDALQNDPYVDLAWWSANLGQIDDASNDERSSSVIINEGGAWNSKQWISLGKLLMGIIGKRLALDNKKYDEVQFVFYNLNGKAIQASFLNIAAVPVDKELFYNRLIRLLDNSVKLSAEGLLEFILNLAVNQKAAAVYGLGNYFKFTDAGSTDVKFKNLTTAEQNDLNEARRKVFSDQHSKSVQAEIYKQYYGTTPPAPDNEGKVSFGSDFDHLNALANITAGNFDLTFNVPKVVMNFDSTYHENSPDVSILRISFYDERDNPFESLTEFLTNFHGNKANKALSGITTLRAKIGSIKSHIANVKSEVSTPQENKKGPKPTKQQKTEEKPADQKTEVKPTTDQVLKTYDNVAKVIKKDIASTVIDLIKKGLVKLKDKDGQEIPIGKLSPETPLDNPAIATIAINIKDDDRIKSFANMKSLFKTFMPSLTFGQSNSALLSGNITTNQDPKYSTVQIMRQNGEEAERAPIPYDFELFNQMNSAPMWVIPAQASAQIIGCPLVNFSQLVFLDFNTGTSIDNMYFINGIRHSISPGKFTTDLTLIQKDVYSQFEAQATAIQSFFESINNFDKAIADAKIEFAKKQEKLKVRQGGGSGGTSTSSQYSETAPAVNYQFSLKINHSTRK